MVDDRLQQWLKELIQIPSVFEAEYALLAYLERQFDTLACSYKRVPFVPKVLANHPHAQQPISQLEGRYNLVIKVVGQGSGRSLILNSHLDVVPPGEATQWTHPPFSGHINEEQQLIYGRGAMDDKAGVAIMLGVLENLLQRQVPLAGDVIFQFVLEDESTGNGSLLCLEAGYRADAAMIIDGTRLEKAISQHAGQMAFSLQVVGKPASVVVSHMGINAAEGLAELILELRQHIFALNEQRQPPWLQFPSPYQISVQRMHSESDLLTLPVLAQADCYLTFPPPHSISQMQQFIKEKVNEFSTLRNIPATVKWSGWLLEPVESSCGELEQVLNTCAAAIELSPITIGPSTGTSDLRHFVQAGIPCMLYGPGRGYNPHRFDEYYHLEDLPLMVQFYTHLVETWCA